MKKVLLLLGVISVVLFTIFYGGGDSFYFGPAVGGLNAHAKRENQQPASQPPMTETGKKLHCGEGENADWPVKYLVSYQGSNRGHVFVDHAFICARDNSADTEAGLRDMLDRLKKLELKDALAPLTILRLKD